MAALFLVMTGTSVLLLRGKSSRAPANAEITVTEEGSPAPSAPLAAPLEPAPPDPVATAAMLAPSRSTERYMPLPAPLPVTRALAISDDSRLASRATLPVPTAPPVTAPSPAQPGASPLAPPAARNPGLGRDVPNDPSQSAPSDGNASAAQPPATVVPLADIAAPYASALGAYQAGRFDDARRAFDAMGPGDAAAELWAARSVREERGCGAAIGRFDRVALRATGTSPGWDALFEGARCRVALGDYAGARSRLESLATVDSFRDRAQAELDRIARIVQGSRRQ